jgi:hypothetical protein
MQSPVIMPVIIHSHTEPEFCPNCHLAAEKKTIEICTACKYEYPEDEDFGVSDCLILFVFFGAIIWLCITGFIWLTGTNMSLVEVLKSQWHWLCDLRVW